MSSAAPRPSSAVLKRPRPIASAAGARSDAVPRRRPRALACSAFTIAEDVARARRSLLRAMVRRQAPRSASVEAMQRLDDEQASFSPNSSLAPARD